MVLAWHSISILLDIEESLNAIDATNRFTTVGTTRFSERIRHSFRGQPGRKQFNTFVVLGYRYAPARTGLSDSETGS